MRFFSKPHPFIFNKSTVLLPGFVTFLVIALFAPFSFHDMNTSLRIGFAGLYGLIASGSVFLVVTFIRKAYPSYSERWTVGKEILSTLIVLTVICLLIFLLLFSFQLTDLPALQLLEAVLLNTLIISLFPVVVLVLFEQYNHQKKQWKKAHEMNERIANEPPSRKNSLIQLVGENGKIELQLDPEELIFLKAEGNYVEVFYGSDQSQKKLIRNRLKALAESLPVDLFFQCHKSYVINKRSIVSVEGNARNFELKLRSVPDSIPVSRTKSEELMRFLGTMPSN